MPWKICGHVIIAMTFVIAGGPMVISSAAIAEDSRPTEKPSSSGNEKSSRIYLIGNSLTWDTVPSKLDGRVEWHVDCGKSLPYIYENPGEPCVKSSVLWPTALKNNHYDLVSVQSHYGATLAEDVDVISKWVEMQPRAVFVIHTGWAHHARRAEEYANEDIAGKMQHSPAYINALLRELKKRHPRRSFRQTHAIELLDRIASDVAAGRAPLKAVSDLHRDAIHMTLDGGRYLMHNAMRHALGQPISNAGFESVTPELKQYLNGILSTLQPAAQ